MTGESPDGVRRFYGKFRGTVLVNMDPEQRGRIMAQVPDVLGLTPSSWAMPTSVLVIDLVTENTSRAWSGAPSPFSSLPPPPCLPWLGSAATRSAPCALPAFADTPSSAARERRPRR